MPTVRACGARLDPLWGRLGKDRVAVAVAEAMVARDAASDAEEPGGAAPGGAAAGPEGDAAGATAEQLRGIEIRRGQVDPTSMFDMSTP